MLTIRAKLKLSSVVNKEMVSPSMVSPSCDIVNSLPNDKILDWSKFKAFAEDKENVTQKLKFMFKMVENLVGKGENSGYQHFLLFPQCFQNASYTGFVIVGIMW